MSPVTQWFNAVSDAIFLLWFRAFNRNTCGRTTMRSTSIPEIMEVSIHGVATVVTDVAQRRLFAHATPAVTEAFAHLALGLAKLGFIVPVRLLFELGLSPHTLMFIRNGRDVKDVSLNRAAGGFRVSLFHAMMLATYGELLLLHLCLCYGGHCSYIADYSAVDDFVYPNRVLWDLALFGNLKPLYTAYLLSPHYATEDSQYGPVTNDPMTSIAYLQTRYYEGFNEGPHAQEIRDFLEKAMTANGDAVVETGHSFNHDLHIQISDILEATYYDEIDWATRRYEEIYERSKEVHAA
jgi:hypothetical protein